jgi:K(+)-stimulated pyrophosphate-energized sodium pump
MIEALPIWFWLAPIGAVAALAVALMFYLDVMSKPEGTPRMIEISQAVREGAMAYLGRQYRVIAIVFAILFVVFLGMALVGLQNIIVPFTFLVGGLLSGITGYIGMRTATSANARTAQAASESLNGGLQVAFRAGAVMGLSVVGLALLNIILLFLGLYFLVPASFWGADSSITQITAVVLASSVGASTMALFARVGGGIYTKAADVGADLVGKVEANIPEDDPRNPAVIADNVGDNVGDVAGMGADLYESYAGAIVAAMALGVSAFAAKGLETQLLYLTLPLAIAGMGAILSVVGMFLVRTEEGASMGQIIRALDFGIQGAAAGIAVLSLPLIWLMGLDNPVGLWLTIVIGLAVGIIIGWATEYFTSGEHGPTQTIVTQGGTGPATVIIQGLAVGMESTMIPVITVGLGLLLSYMAAGGLHKPLLGLYGISLAAVGMLSTLGITLATDAYGPIADNAGGNAEMAGLPKEVRERTDELDAVGNTTAAIGKGFAIGSAALTALALLAAYIDQIRFSMHHLLHMENIDVGGHTVAVITATVSQLSTYFDLTLLNPSLITGLFVGAMTVFYFAALTMSAVGRAAGAMVEEVRRQFREIPGIMEGTGKPDYARCVDISTVGAQREMVLPSMLAIVIPVLMGVLFGAAGVIGLLGGALSTGFVMAVMMANAGGAWDNAKKTVEKMKDGKGKGSDLHKAVVVGDTVGDPFKDTSGPSLNILIKLMSMVSVIFAALTASVGTTGLLGQLFSVIF